MRSRLLPAIIVIAFLPVTAGEAAAVDPGRGRTLYEARCDGCHAQSVHGREKRAATDFGSIRGWVRRWSVNLKLAWSDEEVDDVAAWLNARYYRFACPPSACSSTGRNGEAGPAFAAR